MPKLAEEGRGGARRNGSSAPPLVLRARAVGVPSAPPSWPRDVAQVVDAAACALLFLSPSVPEMGLPSLWPLVPHSAEEHYCPPF